MGRTSFGACSCARGVTGYGYAPSVATGRVEADGPTRSPRRGMWPAMPVIIGGGRRARSRTSVERADDRRRQRAWRRTAPLHDEVLQIVRG